MKGSRTYDGFHDGRKANSTLWTLGYQSLFHMNQLSSQEAQTKSYNEMSHMFFLTCGIYVKNKDMKIREEVVMVGKGNKKDQNMIKQI